MSSPSISRLSDAILVGHIQTSLDGATVLSPNDPVRSALRELQSHNYDQAPVLEDGVAVGFVLARDLAKGRGRVASYIRPILPLALASELSPLETALPWLHLTGFLFLLSGQSITGFVVPSDLNKQAGRSYLYLGLIALELGLAEEVRRLDPDDILDALAAPAAKAVRKRLQKNILANVEADVVAELNLAHIFQIVGAHSEVLTRLEVSGEDWEHYWRPINALRTRVAHSAKPVLESNDEFERVVDIDHRIHALVAALEGKEPQKE